MRGVREKAPVVAAGKPRLQKLPVSRKRMEIQPKRVEMQQKQMEIQSHPMQIPTRMPRHHC
jgi:hypothetical protein